MQSLQSGARSLAPAILSRSRSEIAAAAIVSSALHHPAAGARAFPAAPVAGHVAVGRRAFSSERAERWGQVIVPQGQRYAFWNRKGECNIVDGPARIWSLGSQVEPLKLYRADPDEYLEISNLDGSVDTRLGPTSLFHDPLKHHGVECYDVTYIETGEALVVYQDVEDESGRTERRIIRGPATYVPKCNEWVHKFSWHGTRKADRGAAVQRKRPGELNFEKLRTTPDQMYFDVEDVRTEDDALLTLKVMVFVQLEDVQRLLDHSHDPISEFMNCISADVLEFAGCRSFEKFKEDLAALSNVNTFPQFLARAERVGYSLNKVVFRGYLGSEQLQKMHDEAIQKRTELALTKETQELEQDLKDFKLMRDSSRAEQLNDFRLSRAKERQVIETQQEEHRQEMEQFKAQKNRDKDLANHQQAMKIQLDKHTQKIAEEKEDDAVREAHYSELKKLGVDLSRYLVVRARGKSHRVIEVDNSGGSNTKPSPQVHVHSGEKEL